MKKNHQTFLINDGQDTNDSKFQIWDTNREKQLRKETAQKQSTLRSLPKVDL